MPRPLLAAALALAMTGCGLWPEESPTPGFTKPVAFAILEDYDKGQSLREVAADFALMEELGIRVWRGSFGWDDYEPEPGRYDFAWLHRFADLAARHGLLLRPYIGYTPEWAARGDGGTPEAWNDPPRRLEEWHRFVFRLAREMRRHPHLLSFEIYNEQNAPLWWDGSSDDYRRVLESGSDAVRAANSGVQVLFGGLVFPDVEWMERICAAPGAARSFDVLPIHAYPETWAGPRVTVENYLARSRFREAFLPVVDESCGHKPIWINEAGFPTVPGRSTERDQANWWARAIATFLATPRVEQIGIYELKDHEPGAGVIGEPENYHLGLVYPDRKKKLAFHTVRRLVALLDAGTLTVADAAPRVQVVGGRAGELHHHLFLRPDGGAVLILWDRSGAPLLNVRVPGAGPHVTEWALDGSPVRGPRLANLRLTPGEVRIFELAHVPAP